uniref:CUB domain-containing protein n=1 Tax=Romanomermis culicivorax TaxID=13658 RepID=A0A915JGF8_ROMCU
MEILGDPCGGVVELSEGQTYNINTPRWPRYFFPLRQSPHGQSCTWLLKAPVGRIVEVRIRGSSKFGRAFGWLVGSVFSFNIARRYSMCLDYVEIITP